MNHPDAARLSDFARGVLPAEGSQDIESHLAECPACCEAVANAGKDGFIACLQSAALAGDTHPSVLQQQTQADPMHTPPGPLVDHPRYRVLRLLGQGGMGEVYLAEHRVMKRLVALKVIRQDLVRSPELADRFRREVLAAARLSHPNIVAALDAEEAGGLHFLVMEFVDGASVAAQLRTQGPLPVADACDVARQAARALQHAHEQGLVHRDIKPENLLRASAGTVKVADFGLARLLHGEGQANTTASAGLLLGTVDYVAPEQANDPTKADIRSDIYSLGCALYQLLTGQVPYPGGGVLDKLSRHAGGQPMRLTSLRPEVPTELARIVARMMAPDPANRFATPAEVASALEPFCGQAPPRKPARRWVAAGIGAVALLTLLGALYTFRTPNGTLEIETDDADVAVTVLDRGRKVAIVDGKTGRKVELSPGEYDLVIVDNGKRLELSTNRITITRNKKAIVTATLKPNPPPPPPPGPKPPDTPTPPAPAGLPADVVAVMKGKPDIDDEFKDRKTSPFDPLRGASDFWGHKPLAIEVKYAPGLEVRFGMHANVPRMSRLSHDGGPLTDYVCRVVGQVDCDINASWGLVLQGRKRADNITVRIWNGGMIDLEPGEDMDPKLGCPKVKRTSHSAIRKGNQKNELVLAVKGETLRVFVNGTEVLPSQRLPAALTPHVQRLFTYYGSQEAGKSRFERFTRWSVRGPLPTLPELEKLKPVLDDTFKNHGTSRFAPEGGRWESKEARIQISYHDGFRTEFFRRDTDGPTRYIYKYADEVMPPNYACRLVAEATSESELYWGLTLRGSKPEAEFVIRVWTTGRIDTGRGKYTAPTFAYPRIKPIEHRAIRRSGKNDILFVARDGLMRVTVNGEVVINSLVLPPEMKQTELGLFVHQMDRRPARVVFTRFTAWHLPGE